VNSALRPLAFHERAFVTKREADIHAHPNRAQVLEAWGLCLLVQGKTSAAAEAFLRSIDRSPRHSWARLHLAFTRALVGRFDDARLLLDGAADPAPGTRVLCKAWIDLLERRPRSGEAILRTVSPSLLKRRDVLLLRFALAVSAGSSEVSWFREEVQRKIDGGQDLPPASSLPAILSGRTLLYPGFAKLWYAAGHDAAEEGRKNAARALFAVGRLHCDEPGIRLLHQSFLASSRGDVEETIACLEEATRSAPTDPAPPTALAEHYEQVGESRRALEYLRIALERAPRHAELYRRLGLLERKEGALREALSSFRRALQINPLHTRARLDEANTCARLEDWEGAARAYRQTLAAGLRCAKVLARLARCHEALGRPDLAETSCHQALLMEPNQPDALELLARLENGDSNDEAAGTGTGGTNR